MARGDHWVFGLCFVVGGMCLALSIPDSDPLGYLLGFANLAIALVLLFGGRR